MLIKGVTKKGDAIPYKPEEMIFFAVQRAVKNMASEDKVFWVLKDGFKSDSFTSTIVDPKTGDWRAECSGKARVGYTCAKTDRFFEPKEHKFFIQYESAKDDLGLPDLVITRTEMSPVKHASSAVHAVPLPQKQKSEAKKSTYKSTSSD